MIFQVVAKIDGGTDLARRIEAEDAADAALTIMEGLGLAPIMGAAVKRLAADIKLYYATGDAAKPARVLVWEVA